MKDKKIVVAVKYCAGELNPFDGAALEYALRTGCADVCVVTMAPPGTEEKLAQLTRLGVRAVLLTDTAFAGADTLATARTLAAFMRRGKPDFIFCGRQSTDGDTAQVPPCLSALLGFGFLPSVMELSESQARLRGGEIAALTGRQVVAFERSVPLRFPSIRSRCFPVEKIGNDVLKIPETECGQRGSPTRVLSSFINETGRRNCTFIPLSALDDAIQNGLKKERASITEYTGPRLKKVYYVGGAKGRAQSIAENAEEIFVRGRTAAEIAADIRARGAKAVLWSDEPDMRVLAPQVAGLLDAGLCADCTALETDGERLFMIRPAAGGSITARIECRAEIAMATVRTPGGRAGDVIFSVGRGAEHALEKIRTEAEKRNARLCCSRAVVDDGQLPYDCQVGLTGQSVAPKVYVAFGISGAVQHMCAVERAGVIIAVNRDRNAKIFGFADYGIVEEI